VVREVLSMPGGLIAKAVLAAIGKPPAKEVRANLKRLKELPAGLICDAEDLAVGRDVSKFANLD
jgi:hypothetical protein